MTCWPAVVVCKTPALFLGAKADEKRATELSFTGFFLVEAFLFSVLDQWVSDPYRVAFVTIGGGEKIFLNKRRTWWFNLATKTAPREAFLVLGGEYKL